MGEMLYSECNLGISGDMTVGALLDLGASRHVLEHALGSPGAGGYHLHFGRKNVCGLDPYDFNVHLEKGGHGHSHEHGEGHGHSHEHGEGHGHSHEHEEGHGHSHSHGERREHSHGHGEGHGHSHDHANVQSHTHDQREIHEHAHLCGEIHEHAHLYGEIHEHVHPHEEIHEYKHSHNHEHPHSHGHPHEHSHSHGDDHGHAHRNLFDIYQVINRLESNDHAKDLARRIFRVVAEAESRAHDLPLEQVHLHGVGATDSIVDIISVAVCMDNLGVEDVVVSPLSEGHGHVHCQHGILSVPVPATTNTASAYGLDLRLTDNDGEMVTSTGAAIAAALRTMDHLPDSCRTLKIGVGAGNRVFKQANMLRAMLMETSQADKEADHGNGPGYNGDLGYGRDPVGETSWDGCSMWMMETNLDDYTGEILGFTMELLLGAGTADAWYTSIFMRENRPAYTLSALCRKEDREKLEDIILIHTTTIGIRQYPVTRTVLSREKMSVDTDCGQAEVKVCTYKDKRFYYPEYESVCRICRGTGRDFMTVYREVQMEAQGKGL